MIISTLLVEFNPINQCSLVLALCSLRVKLNDEARKEIKRWRKSITNFKIRNQQS